MRYTNPLIKQQLSSGEDGDSKAAFSQIKLFEPFEQFHLFALTVLTVIMKTTRKKTTAQAVENDLYLNNGVHTFSFQKALSPILLSGLSV